MFAYANSRIRLYHKSAGRYSASPVHDSVHLRAETIKTSLKYPIWHFSVRSTSKQIEKFNTYTDALALDLKARGVKLAGYRLFVEFPLAFCKSYFLRRHFLRGKYGFITAMNYAFFRYLRIAKYMESE